jgi:hypothetical protein
VQESTTRVARALTTALLAVWVGAMIGIAFIAAPLVFGSVPEYVATKDAAASVIGPAFGRVDALGLVATLAILGMNLAQRGSSRWRTWLAALLFVGVCVDFFFLVPKIVARAQPLGTYHGCATTIWMIAILGGLLLLLVGHTPRVLPTTGSPG